MAIYDLKKRDAGQVLVATLTDAAGAVVDLTGKTVTLHVLLSDDTKLVRPMVVDDDPTTGIARYTWVAGDWGAGASADADGSFAVGGLIVSPGAYGASGFVLTVGAREHRMEYEVTQGTTRVTYPNSSYDTLRIIPDIGQA